MGSDSLISPHTEKAALPRLDFYNIGNAMAATGEIDKPRRGRPVTNAVPVLVRLRVEHLAAIDKWIARHPEPRPSRPEAIRRMIAEHLTGQGHIRTRPDLRKGKSNPDAEPPRGNVQVAHALKRKRS